jgi:hypothetical protein
MAGSALATAWRGAAALATLLALAGAARAADVPVGRAPADLRINLARLPAPGALRSRWGPFPVLVLRRSPEAVREYAAPAVGEDQAFSSLVYAAEIHPTLPRWLAMDQLTLERTALRSLKPEFLVVIAFSPYDGCDLKEVAGDARAVSGGRAGYFLGTCGDERYDLAGRVLPGHGLGRDWHLYVPPHHFEGAQTLVIGLGDPPRPVPDIDFGLEVNFAAMGPPARLLEAARRGRVDVVADTVAFGIPVDLADARGNRALLLTSLRGHEAVARWLLDRGADPNGANASGIAPLYAAIFGGHPGLMELLIERGADVNRRCEARECKGSPLNAAITWTRDPALARRLVARLRRAGADPRQEYAGRDAIDWALESFQEGLLPLLR